MDNRVDIFHILRNEGKLSKILVYMASEAIADPYEKNKTLSYQQPIPVDALVRDLSPESLYWKYFGQIPMGSKEIILEKKYKNTIKSADRIKIGDNYFKVRKDDSRGFSILERQDYIVVVVELKTVSI